MKRQPRARQARGASQVGSVLTDVTVGPVAHGGHCVARVDSRVIFVRHALPGEVVDVVITEGSEGDRFWRGDAVRVVTESPDRVSPPCDFSGPGACGGCDFQHVSLAAQRALKAAVVTEQLVRLAGVSWPVTVLPVPGDVDGLGWRTRTRFVSLPSGGTGMRLHRSHEVIEVSACPIASTSPVSHEVAPEGLAPRSFSVAPDGFWQVHPGAPSVLVSTVVSLLTPEPGDKVLDLYAGVGLFAAFLGDIVGPSRVVAVEGDPGATREARANLPSATRVTTGDVRQMLASSLDEPFDLVVLDPPREGARRAVVSQVADRRPRAVAYVACDPASLARDVAIFAEFGYRLTDLRAFDLFPMTHHVECVALLERG